MIAKLTKYVLFAGLLLFLSPFGVRAEFYNYEDKDGTLHFVDDLSKIPTEYRQKKKVYREEGDNLPVAERVERRTQQREEWQKHSEQEDRRAEDARQQRLLQEEEVAREAYQRSLVTPVHITGNRVFVKVSLSSDSEQVDAVLLLDTGASTTLITPGVAARLKLFKGEEVYVQGVGGRVSRALKVVLSDVKLGPSCRKNLEVVIVEDRGNTGYGDGLLGMDFLRAFTYRIDFAKKVIVWSP